MSNESIIIGKWHRLKTWKFYFSSLWANSKNFELRKNDRNFEVNDVLYLEEWDEVNKIYTGRSIKAVVVYILKNDSGRFLFGLLPGYCILSIHQLSRQLC